MQELRDGASSAQTVREKEDEEEEEQGCGSVRDGSHWAKAGNSPRFSRQKPLKNGFVLLLLFTSNLKAKGPSSASQNKSGRKFCAFFWDTLKACGSLFHSLDSQPRNPFSCVYIFLPGVS